MPGAAGLGTLGPAAGLSSSMSTAATASPFTAEQRGGDQHGEGTGQHREGTRAAQGGHQGRRTAQGGHQGSRSAQGGHQGRSSARGGHQGWLILPASRARGG